MVKDNAVWAKELDIIVTNNDAQSFIQYLEKGAPPIFSRFTLDEIIENIHSYPDEYDTNLFRVYIMIGILGVTNNEEHIINKILSYDQIDLLQILLENGIKIPDQFVDRASAEAQALIAKFQYVN